MILVDSSVWIDYLRDTPSWQTSFLDDLLSRQKVLLGDLIAAEVLQGFSSESEAKRVEALFREFEIVEVAGSSVALAAAKNYRHLRRSGITIRSTIDALIATRCIVDGLTLLHSDRDFVPFERELGLSVVTQLTH